MSKGRKKMPGKIHQLHGSFREDRHGGELKVESILPDPPGRLNAVGRDEWVRLSKELHKLGVLTALDVVTLEMYCAVFARWVDAEQKIAATENGAISTTPNGYKQQSAWLQIANNCIKQMQSLAAEFGLTPATRARMRLIENQPKQLDLLELLDKASASRSSNARTVAG